LNQNDNRIGQKQNNHSNVTGKLHNSCGLVKILITQNLKLVIKVTLEKDTNQNKGKRKSKEVA
jgi:hypothetical protein